MKYYSTSLKRLLTDEEAESGGFSVGPAKETPPPPSLFQKMRNLTRAMKEWQRAGRPLAPKELREARLRICNACPFWKPHGNFYLGECTAPGCGCTAAKAFLATSRCTHPDGPKWPS